MVCRCFNFVDDVDLFWIILDGDGDDVDHDDDYDDGDGDDDGDSRDDDDDDDEDEDEDVDVRNYMFSWSHQQPKNGDWRRHRMEPAMCGCWMARAARASGLLQGILGDFAWHWWL